ncbi:MAG: hypothetical protein VE98_C0001G0020 [candidate division Kazan bacterium GW2011_GWA1_50_15]|uniref:Uncharacterized protein n=2 Tax=Bacteria division Kazan-3B-28 TaxID=1798534 RepID=A0A0G1ZGH5_UNCK3|nr:MAG: hypothetical protein VE98_C0001G0020 [candidate division Kazan bacterium GW2011_GWA1_50_15]KKW25697.1 MAG: hypothetical protein VE99_C0001G0336 [candidate division Kazan bacterium GW2011_GWC1_52_13]KKW27002.1 MAG: hypothetical protein VF00_C0002G0329 [candidate division Kazan bacterium GW2011_GWB1_52_7]
MSANNQQSSLGNPTLKNLSQEDWGKLVQFMAILFKVDQRNNPQKYKRNDRHNRPKNS